MRKSTEDLNEGIQQMIADHNANCGKTFYYSEKEVKELCDLAAKGNFPSGTFEIWWNSVKKK